jgi:uncharacterized SAM-binding protein YcdF (DUF218 family)
VIYSFTPYFGYPLIALILLMLWGLFALKRTPIFFACLFLLVISSPFVSQAMLVYLEEGQLRKTLGEVKNSDVVIVMGGIIKVVNSSGGLVYERVYPLRLNAGMELMKAGKAQYLIFVSAKLPVKVDEKTEALVLSDFAIESGLSPNQILVTPEVDSIQGAAQAVKEILAEKNLKKGILVTSAFEMFRSKLLFESEGVSVQSYPLDSLVDVAAPKVINFLPSAKAAYEFQLILNDFISKAYYKFIKKYW